MELKSILLKRHGCTDGLSEEELQSLADDCELLRIATDEILHRAEDVIDSFYLIVEGRFKTIVTDANGREVMQSQLKRGSQFGGLGGAQLDPLPFSVVAMEPSVALKINYKRFLEHAAQIPRLLVNFVRLLGDTIKQTLRFDRTRYKANVVTIIHESSASRPLTASLIDRLKQLGENPCIMTDDTSWKSRSDVPHLIMVENGQWMEADDVNRQVVQWSGRERVFIEAQASIEPDRLKRGIELADLVLVCVSPQRWKTFAQQLGGFLKEEPLWKDKINLVWILERGQMHAPPAIELRNLIHHDFKVSFSDPPETFGNVAAHGIERIVHQLRGVRVGLALGGGAARGMAHLGVLTALEQCGIVVDMIAGTSAGAMTGTLYSMGMDMGFAIERFVADLNPPWLFRQMPGGGYWYLLYKYRRNHFDPMLRKYLNDLTLEQLPIPMQNITVDLVSGEPKVRDHGDAVQSIIESFNLPGLSPPICRNGQALVDGGLVNNVPADVLVRKGCNFVVAVSVTAKLEKRFGSIRPDTPGSKHKPPSFLQTIMRGYLVQSVNMNSVGVQPADYVIEPDVTKFDLSEFTRTDELASIGREATEAAIEEIRSSLSELDDKLFR